MHEQNRATRSFRPDVLLRLGADDPHLLPVDAKYQRYDQQAVDPADIHQLLTYAHGYQHADQIPRALIVHPTELGSVCRSITIRTPSSRLSVIDLVGLDVRQPPQPGIAALARAMSGPGQPVVSPPVRYTTP